MLKKPSKYEQTSQSIRGTIVGSDFYHGSTTAELMRQGPMANNSMTSRMKYLTAKSGPAMGGVGSASEGTRPIITPSGA